MIQNQEKERLWSKKIERQIHDPIRLILIRGLPGSGKTTLAEEINNCWNIAADDFFHLELEKVSEVLFPFDPTSDDLDRKRFDILKTFEDSFGEMFHTFPFEMRERNEYKFKPFYITTAHELCQRWVEYKLYQWKFSALNKSLVVHNTFTQRWELQPYIDIVNKINSVKAENVETKEIEIQVVSLYDGGCSDEQLFERNVHGVPLNAIKAMRKRWQHDWKNGPTEKPNIKLVPNPASSFLEGALKEWSKAIPIYIEDTGILSK